MAVVYIIIIFIFLLKKFLDKQSESSPVQGHFLQEEKINNEENYDQYCDDHFELLIKTLIFCTYNPDQFGSVPYEVACIRSLKEDFDDIFEGNWFECLFRTQLIEENLRHKLLALKQTISLIPDNDWLFETINLNDNAHWKEINRIAEELLTDLKIEQRTYDIDY
ncbi:hypothetical protein ASG22_18305 [Chryseobacterium sp. Leaf405]|uniref:hypothetical protein n=1 Tax=Chryseobacterium sp. Leaf405 TaxID=1736367 RepID=UPI000701A369|nr:hypothetical protein [Chryseobacterium sp. Leaf405]KQT31483.1 hypothetical protein ASG22_18305 [Chryseobacterium sp. Leaf405]